MVVAALLLAGCGGKTTDAKPDSKAEAKNEGKKDADKRKATPARKRKLPHP